MNTENNLPQNDQEIDLSILSKKIGGFFLIIFNTFLRFILFIKKNKIIITFLFILGVVLGYFLDKENKSYTNEIIVKPNFGSVDYLYSKIEYLDSKIDARDTIFLKNLGFSKPKKIGKIKIEPVNDIYNFINERENNFEFVKLMSENGNIEKIIKDNITSKNYVFHRITLNSQLISDYKNCVVPLINYLNNSSYYQQIQKQAVINLKDKIKQNDSILKQIDGILNSYANKSNSANSVFYSEDKQLDEVLKTKDMFENQLANRKIDLINSDKIIKDINTSLNVKEKVSLYSKFKVQLPILFIILFMLYVFINNRLKSISK
ncbi:hypothetical protein [Flavobacterium croceum]|uniref:hypothetical protein n=1 Tax=Flavobacterium croceum TaxID=370975 RepID=UPI0024A8EF0F|nr:hypothetical protein [Flavobacterium croceum]